MKPTEFLLTAMKHVKSIFPSVTMVVFNNQGRWQYMDACFGSPKFDDRIDVSILEEAVDSIYEFPFIYDESKEDD